ncbi:hypothetical protein NS376_12430 [Pseudomonas oryzihabitans]|nr:hypothetical protein NS376_12430 [Pseudomonas psychrotolerans]
MPAYRDHPLWPSQPLSSVARVVTGKTPVTSNRELYGGTIPFVTPAELKDKSVYSTATHLSENGASSVARIPAGSVMVSCIGSLGKVGIAEVELCTNQQINSLVFDASFVEPRYGFHFCRTLKPQLEAMAPSTTIPIVNKSRFSELKIPLPPLPEQRRIAAILDKADALRTKRREAIAKLDQLRHSVFLEMFGDPATNPKDWPTGVVGDMLESAKYGSSEKADLHGDVPILRMNNLTYTGEMNLSDLKYIASDKAEEKYTVRPGDILFNRTNSKELVGKTAVYEGPTPMAYAGYLVRARSFPKHAPEYISAFLNSAWGKSTLRAMCKNIVGMANINAREFQGIKIPIPPSELQIEFRERVMSIRAQKKKLEEHLLTMDRLFSSLQHQAFAGTL